MKRYTAFLLRLFLVYILAPTILSAAPSVSLLSNALVDPKGIFFVSYDGVVNVNSFQLSGLLSWGDYQYIGWYTQNRTVMLGRRARVVPGSRSAGNWETLALPHNLSTSDSHNVIAIGISPQDGRIHLAMDCHSTPLFYTVSEPGLATSTVANSRSWTASRFGSIGNNLGNLSLGSQITYPQFIITPSGLLQFVYRTGISGNGATQLAEYVSSASSSMGSWSSVGSWASASGTYVSTNGVSSTARNLYIHGVTYDRNARFHITGTWREQNAAVSCSSGGLTNHDTTYFYSDDKGRSWSGPSGTKIATSGSNPVSVNTQGINIDSLNADHGLMNQESQTVDSTGGIHAIISYVPGRFTQCVTNYEANRTSFARPFHLYKSANSTWTKVEIPFALNAVGRSQIVLDSKDNIYVVLPYVRIATASKASGWTDWTLVWDGTSNPSINAFGEVTVDRGREMLVQGTNGTPGSLSVLSIFYQEKSSGTTPSAVRVAEFQMNG